MTDARWLDVEDDFAAASRHFANAVLLFEANGFAGEELEAYRARMALMHALQSGYSSVEAGLVRVLEIIGEELPVGADWHAVLIRRFSRARNGDAPRPALINAAIARDLDEARRFRHRAMHAYDDFEVERARPTIEAAKRLTIALRPLATSLRTVF